MNAGWVLLVFDLLSRTTYNSVVSRYVSASVSNRIVARIEPNVNSTNLLLCALDYSSLWQARRHLPPRRLLRHHGRCPAGRIQWRFALLEGKGVSGRVATLWKYL